MIMGKWWANGRQMADKWWKKIVDKWWTNGRQMVDKRQTKCG